MAENKNSENQNSEITENSAIESENAKKSKLKIFGIFIFAAFLVILTIIQNFLGKDDEAVFSSNQPQEMRKAKEINKEFTAQQEEAAESLGEIMMQVEAQKPQIEENATSSFLEQIPQEAPQAKVFKSSSLLISTTQNRQSQSENSQNSNQNSELLDMKDPCVVYDDKILKFRKLNESECAQRLASGNTSKIFSQTNDKIIENDEYERGVYRPQKAKKNNFDPNFLLSEGTFIGCSLNTKIVTMISGQINCTISNDVYSSNGKLLLIEKGSKMSGSFKSGEMNDGMNRIFVVWNNIRTTQNIDIPINSGATDELGGSGLEGWVDHHYLKRFGSAILVSIIDDALGALVDRYIRNKNNNSYSSTDDVTANTRETAKEIARSVLEQFSNIKPTLYRNHGDIVGVYVNRDIDFSGVYELEWRE